MCLRGWKKEETGFFFFLVRRGAACVCVGRGIVCCCLRSKEERSRKEIEACRWKEEENRRVALSACHSLVAVERASYCQRNKREGGGGGERTNGRETSVAGHQREYQKKEVNRLIAMLSAACLRNKCGS